MKTLKIYPVVLQNVLERIISVNQNVLDVKIMIRSFVLVILQRLCHPLREKGKCHHDGKGDIEQQRAKKINRVE
jgi:hypothetical protein